MKSGNLFVKGFKTGFRTFGFEVTNVVNFILIFLVYFIGVGITSLVAKAAKKRFLNLKLEGKTYWKERNLGKQDIKEYYRQF